MPPKRRSKTLEDEEQLKVSRYSTFVHGFKAFEKNIENANYDLNGILPTAIDVGRLSDALRLIVHDGSQVAIHASWFVSLHLHRCCAAGDFDITFNQSFFSAACGLVSRTTGHPGLKQPGLLVTLDAWNALGFQQPDGTGLPQIFSSIAIEMNTNFSVHLSEALPRYFHYFIKRLYNIGDIAIDRIWARVVANTVPKDQRSTEKATSKKSKNDAGEMVPVMATRTHPLVFKADCAETRFDKYKHLLHGKLLQDPDSEAISKKIAELGRELRVQVEVLGKFDGCVSLLALLYRLITLTEAHNKEAIPDNASFLVKATRGRFLLKMPLLFPQRNIGLSCMTIDTKVLRGTRCHLTAEQAAAVLLASPPPRVQKRFAGTRPRNGRLLRGDARMNKVASFKTDGTRVLASVVVAEEAFPTRGKLKKRIQPLEILPSRGMFMLEDVEAEGLLHSLDWELPVGVDPGQRALFTASNGISMPLGEYRSIQGAAKSKARQDNRALDLAKTLPSLKVASTAGFVEALLFRMRYWKKLWVHYSNKWYQRARFQQLRLSRRALQHTINRLGGTEKRRTYEDVRPKRKSPFNTATRREDVPVAFVGHAMMSGTPKGLGPVPVKKMLDEACKQFPVVIVNERRTSITCSACRVKEKMTSPVEKQLAGKCSCGKRFQPWHRHCGSCGEERLSSHREVYAEFVCKRCTRQWDRDENASLNIREVIMAYLLGEGRPDYLIS